MALKLRAAAQARRNPDTFLIARTDTRAIFGLDDALRRAELYVAAGADGIFVEAPQSEAELECIGRALKGVPLLANMLEGGRTPLLSPSELFRLGYSMIAYPTTLIFRVARTMEKALADLKSGTLNLTGEGVDFEEFKEITGFAEWAAVEDAAVARIERSEMRDSS
jgi:2-methylisocitrate lyase-like PEP mutase family enzyme